MIEPRMYIKKCFLDLVIKYGSIFGKDKIMDKHIIIDDVDVSGCDFYDKNKKYCLTLKMDTRGFKNPSCFSGDFQKCIQDSKVCPNTFCDNNPNCYHKQLKRKEQECEELRKANDEKNELLAKLGCPTTATAKRKVFCLQEQLDQLKAENKRLQKEREKAKNYNLEYGQLLIKATNKNNKLSKTLTEIKEIAERIVHYNEGNQVCSMEEEAKQILQKISEALE